MSFGLVEAYQEKQADEFFPAERFNLLSFQCRASQMGRSYVEDIATHCAGDLHLPRPLGGVSRAQRCRRSDYGEKRERCRQAFRIPHVRPAYF